MITANQAREQNLIQPLNVDETLQMIEKDIIKKCKYQTTEIYEVPYNPEAVKVVAKQLNEAGFHAIIDLGKYKYNKLQMNVMVDWSTPLVKENN